MHFRLGGEDCYPVGSSHRHFRLQQIHGSINDRLSLGGIAGTASVLSRVGGPLGSIIYAAAKAAIICFGKSAARELAPQRIMVNAVAPGHVETEHRKSILSPGLVEFARKQNRLGGFAQPKQPAARGLGEGELRYTLKQLSSMVIGGVL